MKNNGILFAFIISAIATSYGMEQPPADEPTSQINPLFSTHNQYEAIYCPPLQPLADTKWLSKLYEECESMKGCDDLYIWLNRTIHNNKNITIPIVNQLLKELIEKHTEIEKFYEEKRRGNPKDLFTHHKKRILDIIKKLNLSQRPESAPSSDQKPVKRRKNHRKKSKRR